MCTNTRKYKSNDTQIVQRRFLNDSNVFLISCNRFQNCEKKLIRFKSEQFEYQYKLTVTGHVLPNHNQHTLLTNARRLISIVRTFI